MHVAIVGAGALGCVYGARLACFAGCQVSVVTRTLAPPTVVRVERIDDGEGVEWRLSATVERAPASADVVVVGVRYEQLDSVVERVRGSRAPIVVFTPMLPGDHERLSAALPGRVLVGMPSAVAYRSDASTVRYWLPRVAMTLIEATGHPPEGAAAEFARMLERAGVRARVVPDVLARNVATTVSFYPLALALDAAGSIDALLGDRALLTLALEAMREGCVLGRAVGKAEPWATMMLRFIGPRALRVGVALGRLHSPEALHYVEAHFGCKLHAQGALLAARVLELAHEKGTESRALERLLERCQ